MNKIYLRIKQSASILILGVASAANASVISLDLEANTIQIGQEAIIQINMDFTGDPTIGGGIDISFDNFTNDKELSFVSYEASDIGDPGLRRDPDVETNKLNSIGVTDFEGLPETGLIGTIKFLANEAGEFSLTPSESTGVAGGFFALVPLGEPAGAQDPDFLGTTITVQPAVIPLPAAFWLMASALGLTIGFSRKKS